MEAKPVKESQPQKNSFEIAAKDVIRSSIRSALCIDDRYAGPYNEDPDLEKHEPKALYNSFRKDGHCDLDIYQFTSLEKFQENKFLLSNKDLIILDWELDGVSGSDYATSIIRDILESEKIPFILIYTNTEHLSDVANKLITEFSRFDKSVFVDVAAGVQQTLKGMSHEPESLDIEIILEENRSLMYEYIMHWDRREDITHEICNIIFSKCAIRKQIPKDRILDTFNNVLRSQGIHFKDPLLEVAMIVLSSSSNIKNEFDFERIRTDTFSFRINGTTILIYHKKGKERGILPEMLFDSFSEALVNDPHNYLSILSIELKDKLRETFSAIGTSFANIDEKAFFIHLENYRTLEDGKMYDLKYIQEFILKGWLNELFQQQMDEVPSLLEYADHRSDQLDLPKPINVSSADKKLIYELVRYCAFISNTQIKSRSDMSLHFGDLFIDAKNQSVYYLCITPACDCLRPTQKINDNFYFVKGSVTNDYTALQSAESDYFSFVMHDNSAYSISWKLKPFTSYIPTEQNDINNLKLQYGGKEVELRHITLLKENYTQRIANESFGYGYRVGIDLPHIPKGEEACSI